MLLGADLADIPIANVTTTKAEAKTNPRTCGIYLAFHKREIDLVAVELDVFRHA